MFIEVIIQTQTTCLPPSYSAGPVVVSSSAQLVAPVLVARGTLSVTTSEIYFEVDEEDPAFRRVDPKVRKSNQLRFCSALNHTLLFVTNICSYFPLRQSLFVCCRNKTHENRRARWPDVYMAKVFFIDVMFLIVAISCFIST